MNSFKKISFIVLLLTSLITFNNSCKKKPSLPTLTTVNVTSIAQITASSGGNVTSDGGAAVTAKGVCWGTATKPTITNSKTSDGTGTGAFTSSLTGLTPNTLYFLRAYATNSEGTAYGNEVSFTTSQIVVATLTTTAASTITSATAVSGGNITANGGGDITARGVCWSTAASPTTADNKTSDGPGSGTFTSNLSGLLPGTIYHIRAYATNVAGTAYGNDLTFKTLVVVPSLTTTAASSITTTTAVSGGNISADGGSPVTARGVCWSTTTAPVATGSHTSDLTGTGSFTSSITGLAANTTYYVRAYATNSIGTAYGNEITFKTAQIVAPTVTTTAASAITSTTATSGGNVTADGGGMVTARGVCWATTANPNTANNKTSDATGSGTFTSSLTGLIPGTTYHIRAYATNSAGTTYGNDLIFTTTSVVPTLTTIAISAITQTTASSGGNITSTGGSTITTRGVCWSTSTNPTIADSHTSDGTGIGIFSSGLTGLLPGTLYYLRAYATNSEGTAYGAQLTFTTILADIDGNIYTQINIGTQIWMVENLKTTRYNDGVSIPLVTDDGNWATLSTPGYCWYNNDPTTYKASRGALYNWFAVNTDILCPVGWHVPSDDDWHMLALYLDPSATTSTFESTIAGGKLKEAGTTHWLSPNTGATNETGFTALPGGFRDSGTFGSINDIGNWWSSTLQEGTEYVFYRAMDANTSNLLLLYHPKTNGFSVRCLKDN